MAQDDRCYACGRAIQYARYLADTRDDQVVYVGPECYVRVLESGNDGYQPSKGGPRLYLTRALEG